MAEIRTVTTLRGKRDEITASIANYEKRLAQARAEPNGSDLYFRYAYAKSDIWSYEKEWRVWDLLADAEGELSSFYNLKQNEVAAVNFGCRVDPSMKSDILKLLSNHPTVSAFQARISPDRFTISFDPI